MHKSGERCSRFNLTAYKLTCLQIMEKHEIENYTKKFIKLTLDKVTFAVNSFFRASLKEETLLRSSIISYR